ncbi:MAG: glycosyltransferase family 4 protein [Chloroflexi bacterium]|nr:glycosyltransferase family 4 protein [Chloroflexota bacterium]
MISDAVAVRSLKDKVIVQELHPQKNIIQFPPWFEGLEKLQDILISRPDDNMILFIGAMNIPPNIEAATYFAEEVLPLIREKIPNAIFYIVGAQPTSIVQSLSQLPGVVVTGEVPDLKPFYEKAAMVVSPLFTGGGIIVKTLNGLASGRPVVATLIGNSGTGAQDREDIYIVSSVPTQFAQAVINILRDEHLWYRLAQNGRSFIKKIIIGLVLY